MENTEWLFLRLTNNKMIEKYLKSHNSLRHNCINLIPSENIVSDFVKQGYVSDLGHRYFFKEVYSTTDIQYDYMGSKYITEIYDEVITLAQRLFNCEYVNIDMHSGHLSNINLLLSYCSYGDTFLCTSPEDGGYPGLCKQKLPKKLGLAPIYFPQNGINGTFDLDKIENIIKEKKPKIAIISSSITLFPIDISGLSKMLNNHNIPLVYDGSHPMGLIAAERFQNPFLEGADYLIGSTHKSFPGPQGGIILGKTLENGFEIKKSTDFICVDNLHLHRIASLGLALHEFEAFGTQYSDQIIINTKALAKNLYNLGIKVRFKDCGFSDSHQLLIDTNITDYRKFTADLEFCNIILDNSGRVGTAEITRRGFKENDINALANLIYRVYKGDHLSNIKKDTTDLLSNFMDIHYTFNN